MFEMSSRSLIHHNNMLKNNSSVQREGLAEENDVELAEYWYMGTYQWICVDTDARLPHGATRIPKYRQYNNN